MCEGQSRSMVCEILRPACLAPTTTFKTSCGENVCITTDMVIAAFNNNIAVSCFPASCNTKVKKPLHVFFYLYIYF